MILILKKLLQKSIMKGSFCSLCNQVVVNPLRASHVSSKDHFAKVIRLAKENLSFL